MGGIGAALGGLVLLSRRGQAAEEEQPSDVSATTGAPMGYIGAPYAANTSPTDLASILGNYGETTQALFDDYGRELDQVLTQIGENAPPPSLSGVSLENAGGNRRAIRWDAPESGQVEVVLRDWKGNTLWDGRVSDRNRIAWPLFGNRDYVASVRPVTESGRVGNWTPVSFRT